MAAAVECSVVATAEVHASATAEVPLLVRRLRVVGAGRDTGAAPPSVGRKGVSSGRRDKLALPFGCSLARPLLLLLLLGRMLTGALLIDEVPALPSSVSLTMLGALVGAEGPAATTAAAAAAATAVFIFISPVDRRPDKCALPEGGLLDGAPPTGASSGSRIMLRTPAALPGLDPDDPKDVLGVDSAKFGCSTNCISRHRLRLGGATIAKHRLRHGGDKSVARLSEI